MVSLFFLINKILSEFYSFPSIDLFHILLDLLATSGKEWTHWKRPWCREGLGAGGDRDDRGWGGWIASPTWWTWVWVNSGNWLWTGRPGTLRFMGLQRVGHDWVTELKWTELDWYLSTSFLGAKVHGTVFSI